MNGISRLLLLAVSALTAGCTALSLGYRNADTFAAWRADEYFDLDADQRQDFDARFAKLLTWHRYEQLPEYAEFLTTAIEKARGGLRHDDIVWFIDGFESRYRLVVARGLDDAAAMLATLRPEQITALQKQWDKDNRKFRHEFALGESARERRHARIKRTLDQIDDWTGRLTREQERRIGDLMDAVPPVNDLRYEDRLRRQREFLELLKLRGNMAEFKPRLGTFLLHWEDGRDPAYARLADEVFEKRIQFYIAVEKILTPEQREAAVRRMQSYIDDMKALSRRAAASYDEGMLALKSP
jgi:hypothetical protein